MADYAADVVNKYPVFSGKSSHSILQLSGFVSGNRIVMVHHKNDSLRIEDCSTAHLLEIIQSHRNRPICSHRIIDIADDQVAGSRVDAGFDGKNFFADGFASH